MKPSWRASSAQRRSSCKEGSGVGKTGKRKSTQGDEENAFKPLLLEDATSLGRILFTVRDRLEMVTMETGVKAATRKEWLTRERSKRDTGEPPCLMREAACYRPGTGQGSSGTQILSLETCIPSPLSRSTAYQLGKNFQLLGGGGQLCGGRCRLVRTQSSGTVLESRSFSCVLISSRPSSQA